MLKINDMVIRKLYKINIQHIFEVVYQLYIRDQMVNST